MGSGEKTGEGLLSPITVSYSSKVSRAVCPRDLGRSPVIQKYRFYQRLGDRAAARAGRQQAAPLRELSLIVLLVRRFGRAGRQQAAPLRMLSPIRGDEGRGDACRRPTLIKHAFFYRMISLIRTYVRWIILFIRTLFTQPLPQSVPQAGKRSFQQREPALPETPMPAEPLIRVLETFDLSLNNDQPVDEKTEREDEHSVEM